MSRDLGYFSDPDAVDFPELNKCPDCETFFAESNCPFCGKACPEEFRAGNRKKVKVKRQRSRGNGRVQFVPWYHSTWFILIMLFFQPLIGLILTWTGVWKTHWKVIVTAILVIPYLLVFVLGGIVGIFDAWFAPEEEIPVNLALSNEEYVALCEQVDVEALFRQPDRYADAYMRLTVTVDAVVYDTYDYESDYTRYYRCHVEKNGKQMEFLVRDWRQENVYNLVEGDVILVYGQGGGTADIYSDDEENIILPCINMRCLELIEE